MRRTLLFVSVFALLTLPAAAAEAPLPWLDDPAPVAVDCGRTSLDLAVFGPIDPIDPIDPVPTKGEPVNSSNPNCICPHAGPGWVMTGDSCVYDPRSTFCTGHCYWENAQLMMGTRTPCGSP